LLSGSTATSQLGSYSNLGYGYPGSRQGHDIRRLANNSLILSGGNNVTGYFNDIWRYDPGTNQWFYVNGNTTLNAPSIYSKGGFPGSRSGHTLTAVDNDLILFAGTSQSSGVLNNDLWQYVPATNQFTFLLGDTSPNMPGTYATDGTGAPGARYIHSFSRLSNYSCLLFAGYGYGSTSGPDGIGYLNDLWLYDPTANQFYFVGGNSTVNAWGSTGSYPGSRQRHSSAILSNDSLLIFDGFGYNSSGSHGYLFDLWRFDATVGQWYFIEGDLVNVYGVYSYSLGNPGSRADRSVSTLTNGSHLLFGGIGVDVNGSIGDYGDLWRYDPILNQWFYLYGSNTINTNGSIYGVVYPGAREFHSVTTFNNGSLVVFGGSSTQVGGVTNDLWMYSFSESPNPSGSTVKTETNNVSKLIASFFSLLYLLF